MLMRKETRNIFTFHDQINWTNKLTLKDKNTIHTALLCLYVADPATSTAYLFVLWPH